MNTPRLLLLAALFLLALCPGPGRAAAPPPRIIHLKVAPPPRNARRIVSRPALDISLYRRSFTPDEKPSLRLSAFNVRAVKFALYRLSLPSLVPTSRALEDFAKPLARLSLAGQVPVKTWAFPITKTYPDQWAERQVQVPQVPPGAYLLRATGDGAEKRTWLAVTPIALLAKRSRQEMIIYAAQAVSGVPQAALPLTVTDATGRHWTGRTSTQGLLRLALPTATGSVWAYGASAQGAPAFVLSALPAAPDPYAVLAITDRPLYRPAQTVQYKATLRRRTEALAPGGLTYQPFARQNVVVEIRDATDALILKRAARTNEFGSLSGAFTLADAPTLGNWQLIVSVNNFRSYAHFQVQEYRKPEYAATVTFPATHYLGGSVVPAAIDARYFFGPPVAHAAVKYTVTFDSDSDTPGEPPYDGQGVTDAQGRLLLSIPTRRLPVNRTLSVHATVTDLSRRPQSGDGSVLIHAGRFALSLAPGRAVYRPGDTAIVSVHAQDYDNLPQSTSVKVTLLETKYDSKRRPYQQKTVQTVTTDAKGNADARFALVRPGDYDVQAESFDEADNKITADADFAVAGPTEDTDSADALTLIADRPAYRPGSTALVLVNTSLIKFAHLLYVRSSGAALRPVYALVTLEGERLYSYSVVRLVSRSTALRVPLTDLQFPSATLHVTVLQDRHIYEQQIVLPVQRDNQALHITITPNQPQYEPGQTASYTVVTRDYLGRPVPAEVSMGVVDASIYALASDNTPALNSVFWGGQEVRVQTDFSFAAMYSGGAFQTMPREALPSIAALRPSPGQDNGIRVRSAFADTAYWNAFVDTGADGSARIAFPVPDNLTTWRATARGLTLATQVGSATQDTVSTLPLLVRLALPRFAVQGDTVLVSALVHNDTGATRPITITLQAANASLLGPVRRTVTLPSGGQQRLDWQARIGVAAPASSPRPADGGDTTSPPAVHFLVTADGGDAHAQDAAALLLPVLPDGLKAVQVHADTLSAPQETRTLAIASLPPGAAVTFTLAPTLAASLFDALDYLQSYPYGCAEQTASSFLPDVVVASALRQLHVDRPVRPQLSAWVSLGLQKLYRYQHSDGGWNWWEDDQTDGDMTAYVLSALRQAQAAGYTVDDQRLRRGAAALQHLLDGERDPSRRADWLLTLSSDEPAFVVKPLLALYARRSALDTYGQASLALALAQAGRANEAATVAAALTHAAETRGTTTFWPAATGGYTWREDDATVTAHVLRALLSVGPRNPVIPSTVRWLMGNRVGSAWASTRASAEAVLALTGYLVTTGELQPDLRARILLDGQTFSTFTASGPGAFDLRTLVTLTPNDLRGHKIVTISKEGTGVLYLTRTEQYLLPPAQAVPQSSGIAVHRLFQVPAEDPAQAGALTSGQQMRVDVDLTADANYRYALLEEPIPAGCEVVPDDDTASPVQSDSEGAQDYVRREVHDNRLVFFFDSLPKGRTHIAYVLRAETPGAFRILPSVASLVYFPEVRGNTGLATAKIEDIQ